MKNLKSDYLFESSILDYLKLCKAKLKNTQISELSDTVKLLAYPENTKMKHILNTSWLGTSHENW